MLKYYRAHIIWLAQRVLALLLWLSITLASGMCIRQTIILLTFKALWARMEIPTLAMYWRPWAIQLPALHSVARGIPFNFPLNSAEILNYGIRQRSNNVAGCGMTLSTAGTYTLTGNFAGSTTTPCISITASKVTLKGNGRRIDGSTSCTNYIFYSGSLVLVLTEWYV